MMKLLCMTLFSSICSAAPNRYLDFKPSVREVGTEIQNDFLQSFVISLKPLLEVAQSKSLNENVYKTKNINIISQSRDLNIASDSTNQKEEENNDSKEPSINVRISFPKKFESIHPQIPKSLQISFEPHQEDPKLKLTDTFFDLLQNRPTENPKKIVTTKKPKRTTIGNKVQKPNTNPQTRPNKMTNKATMEQDMEEIQQDVITNEPPQSSFISPVQNNDLTGQSQIGNRKSQMVIKPTVIVNIRGTVTNTDSDVRLQSRSDDDSRNTTKSQNVPRNVFHINQEVNVEREMPRKTENESNGQGDASYSTAIKPSVINSYGAPEARTRDVVNSGEDAVSGVHDKLFILDDYFVIDECK